MTYFTILTTVCVVLLLVREKRGDLFGQAILKLIASTSFIGCAIAAGALGSAFGHWILVALALSWIGDACLLSRRHGPFRAGLVSFLLAHLAYCTAFLLLGADRQATFAAMVILVLVATGYARWLLPHVESGMRLPVALYLVVISLMMALGTGAARLALEHGTAPPIAALLLLAPLAFYLSDLAVARDRFVARGFVNRLWGLPLYYAAQILFAISVRLL
jgi:uncharacterized membrane protein YhhN